VSGTSGTARIRPAHDNDGPRHIRPAPLLLVTLAFIIGIVSADAFGGPLWLWLIAGGAALGCAVVGLLLRRRIAASAALLAAFVSAGAAMYLLRCTIIPPGHIGAIVTDQPVMMKVRAWVAEAPVTRLKAPISLTPTRPDDLNYETAFTARLAELITQDGPRPVAGRIMVKLYDRNPGIRYGDELLLTGQLQAPNAPTNPAQFDYRDYLRKLGIRAIIYIKNAGGVRLTGRSRGGPLRMLFSARARAVSIITGSFRGTGGAVLAAMLLGADEQLPPEVAESFRRSGTRHLLVVSGLHVAMVAGVFCLLTSLLRLPEWARSAILILCVAGYVAVTGAKPPAVRAGVMIALFALGRSLGRPQVAVNTLALAALIILLFSPGQLFMAGFQLSFVAVLSILYFYRPIRELLGRLGSRLETEQHPEEQSLLLRGWILFKRVAFPALAVSLAAAIGVMPLVARTFHLVSPIGLLCNALLVPFAALVVWSGLAGICLATLLLPAWSGATAALAPAAAGARALAWGADLAAKAPFSHFNTGGVPLWFVAAYYALVLAIIHRRRLHLTPRRLAVLAVLLLDCLALDSVWPTPAGLHATVFDVRHGGCAFFQLPSGKTLMYDCGTASRFFDVAAYVAAPALWERSVHTIDALILSHNDTDHTSGVASLMELLRVGRVVHPSAFGDAPAGEHLLARIDEHGMPRLQPSTGQVLELGGAVIEILGPPKSTTLQIGSDPNNQSLVVRLSASGKRFLLCGDLNTSGIAWLLVSGQDLTADVIFMPHHGSWYPNIPRLLDAVRPQAAVISCDRGYASRNTLHALSRRGIRTFQTCKTGAIQMTVERGELRFHTMLGGR